jgi:hypothetical protein
MGAQAINTAPMATAVHHLIEAQWMAHLSLGGLRPVFDLSQQRRLDPSSMRDLLAIGLGLADQMGTRELKTRHFPECSSADSAAVLKRKRFRGVVAGRSVRASCFFISLSLRL